MKHEREPSIEVESSSYYGRAYPCSCGDCFVHEEDLNSHLLKHDRKKYFFLALGVMGWSPLFWMAMKARNAKPFYFWTIATFAWLVVWPWIGGTLWAIWDIVNEKEV